MNPPRRTRRREFSVRAPATGGPVFRFRRVGGIRSPGQLAFFSRSGQAVGAGTVPGFDQFVSRIERTLALQLDRYFKAGVFVNFVPRVPLVHTLFDQQFSRVTFLNGSRRVQRPTDKVF